MLAVQTASTPDDGSQTRRSRSHHRRRRTRRPAVRCRGFVGHDPHLRPDVDRQRSLCRAGSDPRQRTSSSGRHRRLRRKSPTVRRRRLRKVHLVNQLDGDCDGNGTAAEESVVRVLAKDTGVRAGVDVDATAAPGRDAAVRNESARLSGGRQASQESSDVEECKGSARRRNRSRHVRCRPGGSH